MEWMTLGQRFQVLAKKFLFLLLSLVFPLLSTTHAQTTVLQTALGEKVGRADRTEVVILVPNITCYGRFHDSLKEHLQGKHNWIHSITIRNTGMVRNPHEGQGAASEIVSVGDRGELPFDIGTIAELTITIDSSKSTLDLLKAIRDSKQYSLKRWTVQIEIDVEELLSR